MQVLFSLCYIIVLAHQLYFVRWHGPTCWNSVQYT